MGKHTPGPWEAHWTGDRWEIGNYGTQPHVVAYAADAARVKTLDLSPGEANARLIAAAPTLLQALKNMVSAFNVKEIDPLIAFATIEQARAAIALAE